MKKKKLRSKNRLKNKNVVLGILLLGSMIICIFKLLFSEDDFSRAVGLFILIFLIIISWHLFRRARKINSFFRYADDFEDNDSWLPQNFKFDMPKILRKLEKVSSYEDLFNEMGSEELIKEAKNDLELLHDYKRKTEFKLKEWETVPVPNNNKFYSIDVRITLTGREAIYSRDERLKIKRDFLYQVDFYEQQIITVNKILNKTLEKNSDVKRSLDINSIDGLNIS